MNNKLVNYRISVQKKKKKQHICMQCVHDHACGDSRDTKLTLKAPLFSKAFMINGGITAKNTNTW